MSIILRNILDKKLKPNLNRAQSQELTRQKLMVAGQELFTLYGLNGASIDKIVAKAGFSKGAFYSNFKSKEDLMLAILKQHKESAFSHIDEIIKQTEAKDLYQTMMGFLKNNIDDKNWIIFNSELAISAARNPDLSNDYAQFLQLQYQAMENTLERIFAKLGTKPKIEIKELAKIIKQLMHSNALNNYATNQENENNELIALIEILFADLKINHDIDQQLASLGINGDMENFETDPFNYLEQLFGGIFNQDYLHFHTIFVRKEICTFAESFMKRDALNMLCYEIDRALQLETDEELFNLFHSLGGAYWPKDENLRQELLLLHAYASGRASGLRDNNIDLEK